MAYHFAIQGEIENAFFFIKQNRYAIQYRPSFLREKIAWLKDKGVNVKSYETQLPDYEIVFWESLIRLIENEFILLEKENKFGLGPLITLRSYIQKAKEEMGDVSDYEKRLAQLEINRALALVDAAVSNRQAFEYYGIRDVDTRQLIERAAKLDLNPQERMKLNSFYIAYLQGEMKENHSMEGMRELIAEARSRNIDVSEEVEWMREVLRRNESRKALKNLEAIMGLLDSFVNTYQSTADTDEPDFAFISLVEDGAGRYLGMSEQDEKSHALAWIKEKGTTLRSGKYDKDESGYALSLLGRIREEMRQKDSQGCDVSGLDEWTEKMEEQIKQGC